MSALAAGPLAIHALVEAWVDREAPHDAGCRRHLAHWRAVLAGGERWLLDVPLAIGAALTGDAGRYLPVAAAGHALMLGLDLLDNVAAHELHADWAAAHGALAGDVATLAALVLIASAPHGLLATAGLSDRARAAAALHLADALVGATRGQVRDLTVGAAAPPSPDDAAVTALKTAAYVGLLARLPVLAARDRVDVTPAREAALVGYAASLGAAGQLASDLADVFASDPSRDVGNGRATPPLARALAALLGRGDHDAHARLRELLAAGAAGGAGLAEVRALIEASGALRGCALDVERHLARARRCLADAGLGDDVALHRIVDALSPLARLRERRP